MRNKLFRFPKGASVSVSKSENDHFGMTDGIFFFFLWKIKLIIVFVGAKFIGYYRNVAIISTLFRDHSQNSKKSEFLIVFSTLQRDPEIIV